MAKNDADIGAFARDIASMRAQSKMALLQAVANDQRKQVTTWLILEGPARAALVLSQALSKSGSAITRCFLAARHIHADTLNDLSLEHFFNRVIEFVIALAVLLARIGWPLAFTSTVFARACTGASKHCCTAVCAFGGCASFCL